MNIMKKIKVAIIIVVLLPVLVTLIQVVLVFTVPRGQKDKFTDEYMTLWAVNVDLFSQGEVSLEEPKNIKKISKYKINNNKTINVYAYNPNNNIVVFTLTSYDNCVENSILGVALKKDFINTYNEEKKEDITYPVLRIRKGYGVHITVKSKSLVLPGDIYKDGKVISTYTKEERTKLIKLLKKEACQPKGLL